MVDDVTIRTLAEGGQVEGARLVASVMLGSTTDEVASAWAEHFEEERTHAAVLPSGRPVGLVRWFDSDVSVPGGGSAPAALVSAVAVRPTHRRQGLLTRLMHAQLESIVAEERPVAMLLAAEWPIYGRFGYGPSVDCCTWRLDALTTRFRDGATGTIEEVGLADLRPQLEAMHDLRWRRTPGAVTRKPIVWDVLAGVKAWPGNTAEPGKRRGAIWRDRDGTVQGAVAYTVKDHWIDSRPRGTAEVALLVGATPEAERELWRHLCDLDWIATVVAEGRPVDEPLRLLLVDGRAAVAVEPVDNIWSRILDVPAVFGSYRPATEREAVLEVVDPLGYANGRWHLHLGPEGSEATPTSATADVRLPVDALGAIHLGGQRVAALREARWLDEERPGGVDRVQALFATPMAPWSPTHY